MLQMHDALDTSVTSREQGELIVRLGEEAVKLEVPMQVDEIRQGAGATPNTVGKN